MFVVEDGSGFANANALISVDFADTYHDERGNEAWAALTLARKQQLIIRATDYVVSSYDAGFSGTRFSTTQTLSFPRVVNGVNVGVPIGIKQAVAELALIADKTPLMPNVSRGKKSVKVGSISVEYDGNSPTSTRFVAASLRIAPYLSGRINSMTARLIRT